MSVRIYPLSLQSDDWGFLAYRPLAFSAGAGAFLTSQVELTNEEKALGPGQSAPRALAGCQTLGEPGCSLRTGADGS